MGRSNRGDDWDEEIDMKSSLVEKAKNIGKNRPQNIYTSDEEDLAIAWLKDEVGTIAVGEVMNKGTGSNIYVFLAQALKSAYKSKKL